MRHLTKGRVLVWAGLLIALTLVFVARWAEREQDRRAGARRTVPHRRQLLLRRRDRRLRLPHHRARGPRRARCRLSHHRAADHGEHREARLRHQGRQSAPELGAAPRPRGRAGGAPAGVGCAVVGQRRERRLPRGRRRRSRRHPAVEGPHLDRRPRLPAPARRPSVQGRRHDPCRADRAHRARHRRAYARLHLVVVPRPRWRPRAERRERVRHGGARNVDRIRNKRPTASAVSACCGASPPTSG